MGVKDAFINIYKNLSNVTKAQTESVVRPSISQPYMSTDTGAKLPIFPFPLIMIYELADKIGRAHV
mgnify:FL=1